MYCFKVFVIIIGLDKSTRFQDEASIGDDVIISDNRKGPAN